MRIYMTAIYLTYLQKSYDYLYEILWLFVLTKKQKRVLFVMQQKYVFPKKCKVKLIPVSSRAILLPIFKFWEYFIGG